MGTPEACREKHHVPLQSPAGYLSSLMTEETGYGLAGCPWKIHVHSGQKVELSLLDFNLLAHFPNQEGLYQEDYIGWCPISLIVEEQENLKDIPLCNNVQRERPLYSSVTNEILVHFVIHQVQSPHYYYLIHYRGKLIPQLHLGN